MTKKPYCIFFRPSALNPDVCARWIRPLKGGEPFCLADEVCETQGLRYMPRGATAYHKSFNADYEGARRRKCVK
ncbi:MAG: hypothetical protein WC749_01865 [Dehalococcoidia bacterium]